MFCLMWRWVKRLLGMCGHTDAVVDRSLPGVLRLRCLDCGRVSPGIKVHESGGI